jgi:hypothetical protein
MNKFISNGLTHWKSTVSGFLTITLITTSVLATLPQVMAHPKTLGIVLGVQALAKGYMAWITQDAGTQLAMVPGSATPQAVPSHEIPDQPAAKAVLPASNTPEVKP